MNKNKVIIKPLSKWRFLDLKEMILFKDLLYFLIKRDVTVIYKQTVLGFLWAIIRPVFSMVVFSVIFGKLAKISSDGIPYPIFSYCALVPWIYFSTTLTKSSQSLIANSTILTKVYFPRIFLPLTPIFASLVDFLISLSIVFLMMLYYSIYPSYQIAFTPILVLLMIITSTGISLWVSALAIQYRDISIIMQFLVQILMYAAPVVWPVSLITSNYGYNVKLIYSIYPMASVIEGFRSALIGTNSMPWDMISISFLSSIFIFITGAFYFNKRESQFSDVA